MPTTEDRSDAARAAALAAWIRQLAIGRRIRSALLRDLRLVTDSSAAEESQLRGLDPASFVSQLHDADGGAVARVKGIGDASLAALRRAIPAELDAPPPAETSAEETEPPAEEPELSAEEIEPQEGTPAADAPPPAETSAEETALSAEEAEPSSANGGDTPEPQEGTPAAEETEPPPAEEPELSAEETEPSSANGGDTPEPQEGTPAAEETEPPPAEEPELSAEETEPSSANGGDTPEPQEGTPAAEETEPPPAQETAPADDTLAEIAAAADGLLVPSESDYPLEPFRWQGEGPLTPDSLRAHLELPPDAPVETRTLDAFFGPLARVADWMDEEQREQAARFAALRDLIAARLRDVAVYYAGRVQVTVVIAGQDPAGATVGLRTTLIQT